MNKNIIITILLSFFLKLFDEISDNPQNFIILSKYKNILSILTFLSTILYSFLGSGYSLLIFAEGIFCAFEKQIDQNIYKLGMIILFFGIVLNDHNQIKKLIFTKSGILYLIGTFVFIVLEEKLFPEEESKTKFISRIIIIIGGIMCYYFYIRNIRDNELRIMLTSNWFASIAYYITSVILKLCQGNPLEENSSYIDELIKRVYTLFCFT